MSDVAMDVIDINRIMEMIPHRYPILLVDRMEEVEISESAVGIKNVTMNEPHFMGHFPQKPIMPGVLIVEAMAQTAAILVVHTMGAHAEGKLVYFMTIENARFRQPVIPGDVLRLKVTKQQRRETVWKFNGEAIVNDKVVADASFKAMIRGT